MLLSRGNSLGKWTAGSNDSGAYTDANSGIFEDYEDYSGSQRPYSDNPTLITCLTVLLIFLSLGMK